MFGNLSYSIFLIFYSVCLQTVASFYVFSGLNMSVNTVGGWEEGRNVSLSGVRSPRGL